MNYEQKYKEALERARVWRDKSGMPKDRQGVLDDIFPELVSEDEKMREAAKHGLQQLGWEHINGIKIKDILAWLEKQGEQNLANSAKNLQG